MTRHYRGHIIMLEREPDGAIRYDITSRTGQGAAVGHHGWFYSATLTECAREVERIVDSAIAGDEAKLAKGAV